MAFEFIDFTKGETGSASNSAVQDAYPQPNGSQPALDLSINDLTSSERSSSVMNDEPTSSRRDNGMKTDVLELNEALRIAELAFGPGDPRIASLLNPLAHYHLDNGNYKLATTIFERSLDIQKVSGYIWDHDNVSANLGLEEALRKSGRGDEARKIKEQFGKDDSLQMAQRSLLYELKVESGGPVYQSIAKLALELNKSGQGQQAEALFNMTIKLIEQKYGANSDELQNIIPSYKKYLDENRRSVAWVDDLAARHSEWQAQRQTRKASESSTQRHSGKAMAERASTGALSNAEAKAGGSNSPSLPGLELIFEGGEVGDYDKPKIDAAAEEQRLLENLTVCQAVFGPGSKETAIMYATLGATMVTSDGPFDPRAEKYFSQAAAIFSNPKLQDSSENAKVLENYSETLLNNGVIAKGEETKETAAQLQLEIHAKNNLAVTLLEQGALSPETALALAKIGNAYSMKGDLNAANKAFTEGAFLLGRLHYPENRSTCEFMEMYATFLLASGKQEEAQIWSQRAQATRSRIE